MGDKRSKSGLVDPGTGAGQRSAAEIIGSELESRAGAAPSNPRRSSRRTFNPEVLGLLKEIFQANPTPSAQMQIVIAQSLGMTLRSVQIWFQNRRQRLKRKRREDEEFSPVGSGPPGLSEGADDAQGDEPPQLDLNAGGGSRLPASLPSSLAMCLAAEVAASSMVGTVGEATQSALPPGQFLYPQQFIPPYPHWGAFPQMGGMGSIGMAAGLMAAAGSPAAGSPAGAGTQPAAEGQAAGSQAAGSMTASAAGPAGAQQSESPPPPQQQEQPQQQQVELAEQQQQPQTGMDMLAQFCGVHPGLPTPMGWPEPFGYPQPFYPQQPGGQVACPQLAGLLPASACYGPGLFAAPAGIANAQNAENLLQLASESRSPPQPPPQAVADAQNASLELVRPGDQERQGPHLADELHGSPTAEPSHSRSEQLPPMPPEEK